MFFSRRIIYTIAAALALVAAAEARCGTRGDPDDCPDNSCGELAFGGSNVRQLPRLVRFLLLLQLPDPLSEHLILSLQIHLVVSPAALDDAAHDIYEEPLVAAPWHAPRSQDIAAV
ncbi:hypothetical protein DFH09DRAFT_1342123 [Mycena vulgaris]|nr:hypothetical protein DFH09DRAFT_1342123 [Mycena vulgaris]